MSDLPDRVSVERLVGEWSRIGVMGDVAQILASYADGVLMTREEFIEVEQVSVLVLCSRCGGMGEYQMEIGGLLQRCKSCGGDGSVYQRVVIVEDTE